jgi:hypothetical protein
LRLIDEARQSPTKGLAVDSRQQSLPADWRLWLTVSLGAYLFTLLVTRPDTYIDTFNYAKHIVDHRAGLLDAANDPFWDFGHPLWRPLGYFVYLCFGGVLGAMFGGNQILAAGAALIVWSIAGGLFCVVFLYLLVARLTGQAVAAAVASLGMIFCHSLMNFKLSGCAPALGIGCQIAGFYFLYQALQPETGAQWRALVAGAFLGLSVALWFPFVLPLPGYLCFALLWKDETTELGPVERLKLMGFGVLGGTAVVLGVYVPVMAFRQIHSVAQFQHWVEASRYGIEVSRGFSRVLFSIPRGFFLLGGDNTTLKRVLLRVPGTPISPADVFSALWKPAAVYLTLAVVAFRLSTSDWGRRLLICLAAAWIPLILFAALLFDPSPPERYLGAFPFLFCAFGVIWAMGSQARFSRGLLAIFIAAMALYNTWEMWRFRPVPNEDRIVARLDSLNAQLTSNDLVLVPSYLDDTLRFIDSQPFHPASRFRFDFKGAVPLGTVYAAHWQPYKATDILQTFSNGGRVWISSRLLQRVPSPEWWIEGDENRVRWADVTVFYSSLSETNRLGDKDGFVEVERSSQNEETLRRIANQP